MQHTFEYSGGVLRVVLGPLVALDHFLRGLRSLWCKISFLIVVPSIFNQVKDMQQMPTSSLLSCLLIPLHVSASKQENCNHWRWHLEVETCRGINKDDNNCLWAFVAYLSQNKFITVSTDYILKILCATPPDHLCLSGSTSNRDERHWEYNNIIIMRFMRERIQIFIYSRLCLITQTLSDLI
jgi:hypothetical protein